MDRRFMALRIVATIFKILAWITLVVGLLVAAFMLVAGFALSDQIGLLSISLDVGGPLAGITGFVVSLVVTVVNFLLLYAIGEAVYAFLAIEENTRRTAYIMQQQLIAQQASFAPAPADPARYAPPPETDEELPQVVPSTLSEADFEVME